MMILLLLLDDDDDDVMNGVVVVEWIGVVIDTSGRKEVEWSGVGQPLVRGRG